MMNKGLTILLISLWLVLASCGSPRSVPLLTVAPSAAVDSDVFVAEPLGKIRALRSDGSEQWKVSLADEILKLDSSVSHDLRIDLLAARSGGKIFGLATQLTGGGAGGTILFALNSNRLLWQTAVPYPQQNGAPIAIDANAVYEATQDGALYAFARSDGKQMWKCQVSHGPLGSPAVAADGTIYITGPNYNLHALTPDGQQRWVVSTQK